MEDRFEIEELVTFKYKRLNFRGKTKNISVNGMRIELERYSPILIGEKLIITFRNINNNNLINIPYRVVGAYEMTLSLKLLKDETELTPDEYFEHYIRKNINNLKAVGIKNKIIGLSKGLRNIYIHNHLESPCFFKTNGEEITEYTIANSNATKKMFNKFNKQNNNIQKALYSANFKESIMEEYKNINHNKSYTFKYFVKIMSEKKDYIIYRQESDFSTEEEKLTFLNDQDTGKAFCFKITLNKTQGNFANKYFRDEIKYIEKYSNLKAEEVIDEIERVSGILHIQNITDMKIRQLELLK
jgi:hypothetical protein